MTPPDTRETGKALIRCETCRFAEHVPADGVTICGQGVTWRGRDDWSDVVLPPNFGCVLHEPSA